MSSLAATPFGPYGRLGRTLQDSCWLFRVVSSCAPVRSMSCTCWRILSSVISHAEPLGRHLTLPSLSSNLGYLLFMCLFRAGAVPLGQSGQHDRAVRATGLRAPRAPAFPHQPLGARRREVARERQPLPAAARVPGGPAQPQTPGDSAWHPSNY